ncbi:MAG: hypothetical protein BWY59_00872 [Verrucomicrobia bacterium ADurb.Bin345]|nr:MAG: hypothetical protein BWY59_00872 [Verrucomicrobia bacterium ADurb.Bin345]
MPIMAPLLWITAVIAVAMPTPVSIPFHVAPSMPARNGAMTSRYGLTAPLMMFMPRKSIPNPSSASPIGRHFVLDPVTTSSRPMVMPTKQ